MNMGVRQVIKTKKNKHRKIKKGGGGSPRAPVEDGGWLEGFKTGSVPCPSTILRSLSGAQSTAEQLLYDSEIECEI